MLRAFVLAAALVVAACGSERSAAPAETPAPPAVAIDGASSAAPVELDAMAAAPEPECELNRDCPPHQHCGDGTCTDDPVDGKRPCTLNSGCPKGTNCGTGLCEKTP